MKSRKREEEKTRGEQKKKAKKLSYRGGKDTAIVAQRANRAARNPDSG